MVLQSSHSVKNVTRVRVTKNRGSIQVTDSSHAITLRSAAGSVLRSAICSLGDAARD